MGFASLPRPAPWIPRSRRTRRCLPQGQQRGRARDRPGLREGVGAVSTETHIRKVRPDDIEEVWRVHVASSSDLAVRRGGSARSADEPVPNDVRVALTSDPDGYFCAIEDGRIRGMVSSLVRGHVWYLSMFFVLPGDQGRGVGRALLERALAYGEARGADVRCVCSSLDS